MDSPNAELIDEQRVKKAGKITMKTLITRDELVRESKTGHEAALLKPEDGAKGAGEENALYGGKGDKALSKRVARVDPVNGPLCFLLNATKQVSLKNDELC